jgi:Collagen triple helix repeat (20 copies)
MRWLFASRGASAAATGILVLLLAGGGYAIAASGSSIRACANKRSGALRLANRCKKSERGLSWNANGPTGAAGSRGPQGPQGPQGIQGTQGVQGAPGTAKAYGLINSNGTLSRSSGNVTVSKVNVGEYCVTVSGVDAQTEGGVATPDFSNDSTMISNITHVELRSDSSDCPVASQFDFETSKVTANSSGLVYSPADEGFFFVVP